MITNCIFIGQSVTDISFEINGIDVWKHEWIPFGTDVAEVKDPYYNQRFLFQIFSITVGKQFITFAAGEFSNSVWGFYQLPITNVAT
jgi:hypothetical protein